MKNNCKLIAEIGWNFIGDMTLAKEMIIAAKESGADYAKFQTWSTQDLKPGAWDNDGRIELYKKAELSPEKHHELKEYCDKYKIEFLTSVFNKKYFNFLKDLKLKSIKIASMEINNKPLIADAKKNFQQVFISTGATKLIELEKISQDLKGDQFVMFHCVSSYPTPAKNVNLPRIEYLKKHFSRVGYSGHYKGISDAIGALDYDIEFIEKHFTIDNNLPGRDNQFSILPQEMKILSDYRNNLNIMNKDLGPEMQDIELDVHNNMRQRWSKS